MVSVLIARHCFDSSKTLRRIEKKVFCQTRQDCRSSIGDFVMLKVLFYFCGDRNKASSRVRGYWIAEALEAQGTRYSFECRHHKRALLWFLLRVPFYDVVFFQKTYSRWHCLILYFARLLKRKTILDLDDAPSRINSPVTLKNVTSMLRCVTAVTVGSRALYEYASQYSQNVHLIPSSICLKYYQPVEKQKSSKVVCLGWIGNGKYYKLDLTRILKAPLTKLAKQRQFRLKLVGACGEQDLYNAFSDIPGLKLDIVDQIEWADPEAVANAIQDFDIGLYPLLPNSFNHYKCGFKALEYMAMRIPVVSSNVAENCEIVEHGVNGLIAETCGDWTYSLETLTSNTELRQALGRAARSKVEEQYTIAAAAKEIESIAMS